MDNIEDETNKIIANLNNIIEIQNIEIQQLNNELIAYKNHNIVLNNIIKNCEYNDIICGDI